MLFSNPITNFNDMDEILSVSGMGHYTLVPGEGFKEVTG